MAELPEITKLAGQMHQTLVDKRIQDVVLLQEKCANIAPEAFQARIKGASVTAVGNRGKWILTALDNGEHIALSLGMGADVRYFEGEGLAADKYQVKVLFADGSGYTARFWWFGKFLLFSQAELESDPLICDIAIDPFDERFTYPHFLQLIKGKRTQAKAFLLDQRQIGGIGNMYAHDILFQARLHPKRKLSDMGDQEQRALYGSIMDILTRAREKGAFVYEGDFFGRQNGFGPDQFLVGYKEGQSCPVCGDTIVLIKTGSTSSFICPSCQT